MPRLLLLALAALLLPAARATAAQPGQEELKRLSIEELMRIDVTTAARRPEPLGTTASAISVITGDDIRRAGVTTIADALQLADGVHVARVNNGSWRISTRGFNGQTPNKLLVMIDGRTVYSPLFAGVFWNTLDYVLDDIDRIEVIRGPGGVLWGANAVNGVVNIITRHTRDTRGALVSLSTGNEHPGTFAARYGGGSGDTSWRGYATLAFRDAQRFASGASSADGVRRAQGGFRFDTVRGGASWLVKGDVFNSRDDLPDRAPGEFTDVSFQARWSTPLADASSVDVQSYYRREYRRVPEQLTHEIHTVDLDAQHATVFGRRHSVVWGGGVRGNWDTTEGGAALSFDPASRSYPVFSVFAQDEIAVVADTLFATAGLKYEHNAFSGGELQPNLRARLLMPRNQVLWGAVSRAVRRPTRLDDDLIVRNPAGVILVRGTGAFRAEELIALELGYRVRPSALVSLDATVFHHTLDDLRSQDLGPAGPPITIGNTLQGTANGVEIGLNVQPRPWWRTHAGYTWLDTDVERQPGSRDISGGTSEVNDPHHLFHLRNSLDLPGRIELDAMLRAIGDLPDPHVPAFAELSLRLGWRATPAVDVWITGQDLLHASHPEAGAPGPGRVEFERAVRAGLTIRLGP